jgi:L-ascorbate metabolism protein UlaG (beta-lactamase superfamily)
VFTPETAMRASCLLLCLLFAPACFAAPTIRLIGNAGLEISDAKTTLLVDFPYQAGAFGYMTFPGRELASREGGVWCFSTHGHRDHFDAEAARRIGCRVGGPTDVVATMPESHRWGEGPRFEHDDLRIDCVATPHASIGHCSPRIQWGAYRLYVSGDVEDASDILAADGEFDVIVLSYWLHDQVPAVRARHPRAKIVLHHRRDDEPVDVCDDCVVPRQGERIAVARAIEPQERR